ncbi:MAG: glycosyltransferase family 39 protein [Anaerolineae bacterium]|nr:glycosyltransferase family 39 protein [Anaerolineae bacterium]
MPDEPAHYNYIAQLHAGGCCPVMQAGDYDQAYLSDLTAAKFAPETLARLDTVQYEDHQPPLYYVLAWPVFALTGGDLTALRLFSVVLGAGVVAVAWAVVRALFPARPWFALTAAAFVAFVPQHVAMMAGVNNDSLAELLIGGALLASVLYVRGGEDGLPVPHPAALGALVGLAVLTKTTAFFTGVVALAAVWLRWRRAERGGAPHWRPRTLP